MPDISSTPHDWFSIAAVREKIRTTPEALTRALSTGSKRGEFSLARDVRVVSPKDLPNKPGLSTREGQARLLHDLASIELQALELGIRTLEEFPEAPRDFREELAEVTAGEARHLGLCLDGLEALGFEWGHWDVHLSLWNVVGSKDSLLDRILIVHRYLEGGGLDAGESMLYRMKGVNKPFARPIVETITKEEVDHVAFGSRWYRKICAEMKLDPSDDFAKRIDWVARVAPRRERLAIEARLAAGFTRDEIAVLAALQP
jgi:uncharacterized ferritin-like protein (DUF455 family)